MDTIREALDAAFDKAEGVTNNDTQTQVPTGDETRASSAEAKPATSAKPTIGGNPAEDAKPAAPAGDTKPVDTKVGASITDTPPVTTQKLRAPASWKPELRERWSQLSPEVQAEVVRRERDISTTLQQSAEARQFHEQFAKVAQPYQHYIALEGNDPLKAFSDYLKTAATLRGGSPQEKAIALAQAIQQYGIDVQLLDSALASAMGGQPMQYQQRAQPEYRDPRLDQLLGIIQERTGAEQAALTAATADEISSFAADEANEFFNDVREDIADILEVATARGRTMTLKQAYDRACELHPDISKILSQRKAAATAAAKTTDAGRRRVAASSVSSRTPPQQGTEGTQEVGSVRESIEQAIAQLS